MNISSSSARDPELVWSHMLSRQVQALTAALSRLVPDPGLQMRACNEVSDTVYPLDVPRLYCVELGGPVGHSPASLWFDNARRKICQPGDGTQLALIPLSLRSLEQPQLDHALVCPLDAKGNLDLVSSGRVQPLYAVQTYGAFGVPIMRYMREVAVPVLFNRPGKSSPQQTLLSAALN